MEEEVSYQGLPHGVWYLMRGTVTMTPVPLERPLQEA